MYEDKESLSHDEEVNIHTYFAKIPNLQDEDMGYTEYLHVAYDLSSVSKNEGKFLDTIINLSKFLLESKSLYQILRLNGHVKEK